MKKILIISSLIFFLSGCSGVSPFTKTRTFSTDPQNINKIDAESGMTPLTYAVWQLRDVNAVREVLNKGADVNIKTSEGLTALEFALNMGRMDIVNELIKGGAQLYEPERGKARLFFIGEGFLLRDTWVQIGAQHKNFKKGRMDFIDVVPGNHMIEIPVSWGQEQPKASINVMADKVYFFTLSPTTKHNVSIAVMSITGGIGGAVAGPAMAGTHAVAIAAGSGAAAGIASTPAAIIVDNSSEEGHFKITLLDEATAKEKIKAILLKE